MTITGKDTALSLEEQIKQLKTQLAHAQRLTALGELLGTTTHEFNNVLMTVINYAKLGLRNTDDASRNKAFERILAAGIRANKISSTILSVARNRSQGMEATDLVALTEDTLVLLERELRKYRISVEKKYDEVSPCWANGNQIQQVLLNLLINARQAMPDGGRVLIWIRRATGVEALDMTVRDTGQGIPPDKLPKIFDSFFTTKDGPDESGKGGTGLGLSSCRDIIELHRGKVRVESTVGKGTAFTIRLPLAPARPSTPKTALKTAPTEKTDEFVLTPEATNAPSP
jgi:signal transduction histidine kinase